MTFGEGLSYFLIGAGAGIAVLFAPSNAVLITGIAGSANSFVGQSFNEEGKFSLNNINGEKVLFDGAIAGATSFIGGELGKALHVDKWFRGIDSPLLRNWFESVTTNTIIGGTFGGLGAIGDNDPNTTFANGAWSGVKMGVVTGTISGLGNAVIYSQKNEVNIFTGKYDKPLYHYTTTSNANLIMNTQLGFSDDSWNYLTTDGTKAPLQAQIELALPQNNNAEALIMIKPNSIYPKNIILQGNVQGNINYRGGGGYEIVYKGTINSKYLIRVIQLSQAPLTRLR